MFLKILDEEFPENQMFHKIFNLNTVKISYSCMPNFKENIDGSKKSTLQKTNTPPGLKTCKSQISADCPMVRNCLKPSVVYQATITTD